MQTSLQDVETSFHLSKILKRVVNENCTQYDVTDCIRWSEIYVRFAYMAAEQMCMSLCSQKVIKKDRENAKVQIAQRHLLNKKFDCDVDWKRTKH